MVVVMRVGATEEQIQAVEYRIKNYGLNVHPIYGVERTVIGIVGDEKMADFGELSSMPGVERAIPISKPYKLASREHTPEDRVIKVDNVYIGGRKGLVVMAGPCSVEDESTTLRIAEAVKEAGADIFRAGAYKPRTSPWSYQGAQENGLKILGKVKAETGMPVITEVMQADDVPLVEEYTDIFQIGMRNMRNAPLLNRVGRSKKSVLLKRGDSSTIIEWLTAADYVLSQGNENVMLCERGIRTFEDSTRNTFDINAVPFAKQESYLPVIADPSHGTGKRELVYPVSKAAIAAGADGLLIEAHINPEEAMSDGMQTVSIETLKRLIEACREIYKINGASL